MGAEMIRAVLWDLDGTLLDSAEFHWQAWQITLGRRGMPPTRQWFDQTFGQTNYTILKRLFGPNATDAEISAFGEAKETCYRELILGQGAGLLPGARHWLDRLAAEGWRQALATSAPRLNVDAMVDALGIRGYFQHMVSGEDVARSKPDPQVFLLAAAKLGAQPAHCVVVEDSPAGVLGGQRAGARTIGVGPLRHTLSADLTVASLADLPNDTFDRLVPPMGDAQG